MRGVHSAVDDIRRNVFTEVARLAYEGGDLSRVDMIPYQMIPGEVAQHRHDVFLERAVIAARVRLALGMDLTPGSDRSGRSGAFRDSDPCPEPDGPGRRLRIRNILKSPWSTSFPLPVMPAPPSRSGSRTAARAAFPTPA